MSTNFLDRAEISVVRKVGMTRDHELMVNSCVQIAGAGYNIIQPKTSNINVSVLTSTSIAVYNQVVRLR